MTEPLGLRLVQWTSCLHLPQPSTVAPPALLVSRFAARSQPLFTYFQSPPGSIAHNIRAVNVIRHSQRSRRDKSTGHRIRPSPDESPGQMAQRKAQATLGFRQTRNASTQGADDKTSHAAPARGQSAGTKRKLAAIDPNAAKTPVDEGTPRGSTRARKSATADVHVDEKLENGTGSVEEPPKAGNKSRGTARTSQPVADETSSNTSPAKARIKRPPESDDESPYMPEEAPKTTKKAKTNNYGLTPGVTPFPNWPAPSPETCEEVARLLGELHGSTLR